MSELKERLDILLIKNDIFQSRERARENILNGNIYVEDRVVKKCGKKVLVDSKIEFKGEHIPYVGRGGLKLEKAIKSFNIDLSNKKCIDIGASTGGFTDCMLKNNAALVYAIDVGSDQLHHSLRTNPKVISMENTNIRYVKRENIDELCDFASIDVSFISLEKVIPSVVNLLNEDGRSVALIKPQFEAGKGNLNKKGVVKNISIHSEVINRIVKFLTNNNLKIIDLCYSPIKGPNGNIEYLIYFTKQNNYKSFFNKDKIDVIIKEAQEEL
jgi:23S rRNA (cytidine1920-2'-O)/16S rRNA (cytidine1409-2'-O)-methyltransferase